MDSILIIVMMIIIGAFIGGMTNSLAIKMLFRPYRAMYLGKWKVPFTPGLIPKRREELADQLGRLVMEHLLTADSVKRRLMNSSFQKEMTNWIVGQAEQFLSSDETIEELAKKWGINNPKTLTEEKVQRWMELKYDELREKYGEKELQEVIPSNLLQKMESYIPELSKYIIQKGQQYFESEEGKAQLQKLINDFVSSKGMLGNMIQMFLGNVNLVDKVQPEVMKFLANEGTKQTVESLLNREWQKLISFEVNRVEEKLTKETILGTITNLTHTILNIDGYLHRPLSSLVEPIRPWLVNKMLPTVIQSGTDLLLNQIDLILQKLQLATVVKEQVESFSLERLEEIVLSVSRRELKMITYLGALLGGLIGLIQGLLVLVL